jgi:hypothetical protein
MPTEPTDDFGHFLKKKIFYLLFQMFTKALAALKPRLRA